MDCTGGIIRALIGIALLAATLSAERIEGNVVVTRRLTRKSVTPAVATYQRGSSVELRPDEDQDAIAFERSHVVVWVEGSGVSRPAAPRAVRASIEQSGRRFVPDLVVVPAGSIVSFPNLDSIFHNVFSLSKPKEFDLGNYPKGDTRTVVFPRPGVVYVECHLHPNMSAAIVVTPDERCTKAAVDGKFSIEGVTPGSWTVVAWHRTAGFYRQKIQVLPGQDGHAEFLIPVRGDASGFEMAERQ